MSERCKLRNLVAHGIYDNFYLRLDLLGIIAVTVLSWVINQTYDHTHKKFDLSFRGGKYNVEAFDYLTSVSRKFY